MRAALIGWRAAPPGRARQFGRAPAAIGLSLALSKRIENVFPEVRVQVILGSAEKGTGVLPDLDTELQNSSSEI